MHRSDGSGTTFIWTDYLSKVSPEWKSKVGVNTAVEWPVGLGAKGNEGVANNVGQTKGSIGYVEYAYVLQNGMSYASLQNAAGNFVMPSAETFSNAAATADWAKAQDFNLVMTNAGGPNAYPITASVFILLPTNAKDPSRSKAALEFFRYVLASGQDQAKKLDYVPLPAELVKQIEAYTGSKVK